MSTEENKALVLRHEKEVLEEGRVDLIDSYYAPDGSVPDMDTPEQWRERVLWHHKTCPGFKVTILDLMAEGDKVMAHVQFDLTYSVPADPPPSIFHIPLGKPVSWRIMGVFRIVNGKMVSAQYVNEWTDMKIRIGVIPLKQIEHNRAAVRKFVDGVNQRDTDVLAEVCTPEVAKSWTEMLPRAYARFKDHHIELVDMVADGESVAVKLATSGYHTGEFHGIPPTGKWWTNHGNGFFHFIDGKIADVDLVFDVVNHIKQLGGSIQPPAA
jgi:predicted ester cyclase